MRQPTTPTLDETAYSAVLDATYRKSSYSNGNAGCVSVAVGDVFVGVRDSKLPAADSRASTLVSSAAMRGFLRGLRDS